MTSVQIDALWFLINKYTTICGGDPTRCDKTNPQYTHIVSSVEHAILCEECSVNVPSWLAEVAEALGEVRSYDSAPYALNYTQIIEAIQELREDRDYWKAIAQQQQVIVA